MNETVEIGPVKSVLLFLFILVAVAGGILFAAHILTSIPLN